MAECFTLLSAAGLPDADDKTPQAAANRMLALLSWAEGHGSHRGLRPGPGGLLRCCDGLAFEVGEPVTGTAVAA